MNSFVPTFECKHCGKITEAQIAGGEGMVILCDCKGAREEWEREHRAKMEQRKRAKRRFNKRGK